MDFTLKKYLEVVDAALKAGFAVGAVDDLFENRLTRPFVVLRHDVDRKPLNALAMAKAEAKRGVRASYYFRSVPVSFVPAIITEIRDLGHEIGYHYEDWHEAKYDADLALRLFEKNLAQLRALAPVKTICMHGSPLSREGNMTIWNHWKFADYDLRDCILSHDYTGHAFFTDSGRTFGVSGANLRDELGNADGYADVRSTQQLCEFLMARKADRIMISCHPERWSDAALDWSVQFAKDQAVNLIKHGIRFARAKAAVRA
jgi:hypothetical protein